MDSGHDAKEQRVEKEKKRAQHKNNDKKSSNTERAKSTNTARSTKGFTLQRRLSTATPVKYDMYVVLESKISLSLSLSLSRHFISSRDITFA